MADVAVSPPTSPKPKAKHPITSVMVNKAIKELKEKRGSSLQAIKKFIVSNYHLDADKVAPLIRRYLKSAVEQGKLVQTKGQGATGSFKLEGKEVKKPKAVKEGRVEKKKPPKKPKEVAASPKKAVKPKNDATSPKKAVKPKKDAVSPKKAVKSKSPSKAKKTTKPPTKKPKSPKPKKVAAKPKVAKKAVVA